MWVLYVGVCVVLCVYVVCRCVRERREVHNREVWGEGGGGGRGGQIHCSFTYFTKPFCVCETEKVRDFYTLYRMHAASLK